MPPADGHQHLVGRNADLQTAFPMMPLLAASLGVALGIGR
jgi:hypothetical protein